MKKLVVNKKYDGKKIVSFLLAEFNNLKQSSVYKALRKKDIIVNDKRINENIVVHTGDLITIYITDEQLYGMKVSLDIVYEDDNILIVNKPAGITVTDSSLNEQTLYMIVRDYCKMAMPCHRLDRNTCGLIIFAKNGTSREIIMEKFGLREIDKYYVCIVYGIPREKEKQLEGYLFKDNKKSTVYVSDTPKIGYIPIITHYKLLNSNSEKNLALLEVKLETGRTHQIRAHLAHIGYPIIGDGKYGVNKINKTFNAKAQYLTSYKMIFNFKTDAGILNYLNGKEISISFEDYTKLLL